jgi:NDP-sugar pyrophosphorylase family protein
MWWKQLEQNAENFGNVQLSISSTAKVAKSATLEGLVVIGHRTMICPGAFIQGPVWIENDCMIGNNAMIRGPLHIGSGTRIGYAAELKNAVIGDRVAIGPLCYVADSVVEDEAYLGALVRTSNQRLDRETVKSMDNGVLHDTGLEKLGCLIGAKASLGIQVIILPGRIIAPGSIIGPRITIEKNLKPGRYTLKQELNVTEFK